MLIIDSENTPNLLLHLILKQGLQYIKQPFKSGGS